ncbi:MAG: RNA methyltransferase [Candidatus Omnitrophica bacterium]|nr:RNA methyltransferase [Candidatus Omnitrophota bacterium]
MICVILVEPESSDNIGAVARAMKNMGLADLRLILPPKDFKRKAKKMAMSAQGTLRRARVFKDLKSASKDLQFLIGTTRRLGKKRGYSLEFSEALYKLLSSGLKSGIVFGKESKGLANSDLSLCDAVVTIPSSSKYPSLNLAQAVMIFAFELFFKSSQAKAGRPAPALVSKARIHNILQWMHEALTVLKYHPEVIQRIQVTFSNLLKRAGLEEPEAQMFTGLFQRIHQQKSIGTRFLFKKRNLVPFGAPCYNFPHE